MIISNYELPDSAKRFVRVGYTPEVFKEPLIQSAEERPEVLVWRDAMHDSALEAHMMQPEWPIKIFSSLAKDLGWNWDAKHSRNPDEVITDSQEILRLTELANGVHGRPDGNIIVTLNLRSYESKTGDVGGYTWWLAQKESNVRGTDPFADSFLLKLTNTLRQAHDAGVGIYTEQMSLVITKDPESPITTLTPTLHSDIYYGERESTLCSILEPGYNPYGGTLSAPTIRMTSLESHLPIDINKFLALLPDTPLLKLNSGDIMLHDGMIGPDGKAVLERGLPHISPDIPGKSSRIVFLMRHRQLTP